MLTILLTILAYSLIATVVCLYKDNSSYHMMDDLDVVVAGPCMWILALCLWLLRPVFKKIAGKKKKKETVYSDDEVRKTVTAYVRIFRKRNQKKKKESPWVIPQRTYLQWGNDAFHPYELKLHSGLYERLENRYCRMCFAKPDVVFAVLAELGHPVSESSDWANYSKEWPHAGEELVRLGAIEL